MKYNKLLASSVLTVFVCVMAFDHARAQDNIVGLHGGLVFPDDQGFYVDDPANVWLDRDMSIVLGGQFYRRLSSMLMVGAYAEFETLNSPSIDNGSRLGFGLTYVGRFPEDISSGIGFELGGLVGGAFASADDFDSQFGAEYGAFAGPVLQVTPDLQAAIHFHGLYGWYGGGDIPEGVQNIQPRLRLNLYYGL